MKGARLALVLVAGLTVLATALAGILVDISWGLLSATTGLLGTVLLASYLQIKTLQKATQRLSGLQKQQKRLGEGLQALRGSVGAVAWRLNGMAERDEERAQAAASTAADLRKLSASVEELEYRSQRQLEELERLRVQTQRRNLRDALDGVEGIEVVDD